MALFVSVFFLFKFDYDTTVDSAATIFAAVQVMQKRSKIIGRVVAALYFLTVRIVASHRIRCGP